MFWYLAYMGLLITAVALWALLAFRETPPDDDSQPPTTDSFPPQ